MAAPVIVSEQDLHTLLEIFSIDRDDSPAAALPPSLLSDLMGQVCCDCVTFVGLDSAQAETWAVQGQPTADFLGNPETFWQNYWDCESCSYPDRSGTCEPSPRFPTSTRHGGGTTPDIIQTTSGQPDWNTSFRYACPLGLRQGPDSAARDGVCS
jgi:hypothetical protein